MPLWGKNDNASNSVISVPAQVKKDPTQANANLMYGNTSAGAFVVGLAYGMFAVSATEAANTTGDGQKIAHAGWVLRKAGTGPIISITISAGGTGYSNSDLVKVVPANNGTNAAATIGTNANGVITTITITNPGAGFVTVTPAGISVTNATGGASAGSNAVLVATAGGRAGRVNYETLVATGQIIGDAAAGADDTIFPGT